MGWFSSSSNEDNSSSSANVTDFTTDDAPLQGPTSSSSIGTGPTAALKQRIQQEAAMANARALVTVRSLSFSRSTYITISQITSSISIFMEQDKTKEDLC